MSKKNKLFNEWVDMNDVMAPWRSRFDDLRERFAHCEQRDEAIKALVDEGYGKRYPKLPEWLK